MRWAALGLIVGLSGCGYRAEYQKYQDDIAGGLASGECNVQQECGDIEAVSCRSEVDGPLYYVEQGSRVVLEVCGGACLGGPGLDLCVHCPPPEWTCN